MNMEPIENQKQKDVSFCKRKKHIMKKLIELSTLCDVNIFMTIFNKEKQAVFEYRSETKFDADVVQKLTHT